MFAKSCPHNPPPSRVNASAAFSADVRSVMRACPRLRELSLAYTSATTDTLTAIASCCPNLETLNLRGCAAITDSALVALSRGQLRDRLAHLDLRACPRVTDAGVRTVVTKCQALESLHLRWCAVSPGIFEHAVKQCPRLISASPAGPFNIALFKACHANADRAARVRVNVRCDRCSTVIFGSFSAREVVVDKGSQLHLANEIYTDMAPSNSNLVDVSSAFGAAPGTMRNCPKFVHQAY